jgi:hypothetical protein
MRRFVLSMRLVIGFCLVVTRIAAAVEPAPTTWNPLSARTCPSRLLGGCCDDYSAKPLPCPRDLCYGGGYDDYCMKPLPCVGCLPACRSADCYCPKPYPDACRPLSPHFFSCPAGSTCCADRLKRRKEALLSVALSGTILPQTGQLREPSLPSVPLPIAFGTENANAVGLE